MLGEVTAIDPANKKISVKAETGQAVTVSVDDKTLYRRIPTLKLACALEDVKFKHDAFIYGVHELPVAW